MWCVRKRLCIHLFTVLYKQGNKGAALSGAWWPNISLTNSDGLCTAVSVHYCRKKWPKNTCEMLITARICSFTLMEGIKNHIYWTHRIFQAFHWSSGVIQGAASCKNADRGYATGETLTKKDINKYPHTALGINLKNGSEPTVCAIGLRWRTGNLSAWIYEEAFFVRTIHLHQPASLLKSCVSAWQSALSISLMSWPWSRATHSAERRESETSGTAARRCFWSVASFTDLTVSIYFRCVQKVWLRRGLFKIENLSYIFGS